MVVVVPTGFGIVEAVVDVVVVEVVVVVAGVPPPPTAVPPANPPTSNPSATKIGSAVDASNKPSRSNPSLVLLFGDRFDGGLDKSVAFAQKER
jgi:hypothetical protein